MNRTFALVVVATLYCANAHAFQVIEGRVTTLQPTYLPGIVSFQLSAGSAVCPSGAWLQWANPDQSNNRTVYATLLAALTAEKTVRLYINDGDTTCTGVFIHVLE